MYTCHAGESTGIMERNLQGARPSQTHTVPECGGFSRAAWLSIGFNCENLTIEDDTIILSFGPLSAGTYMVKVDTGAVYLFLLLHCRGVIRWCI